MNEQYNASPVALYHRLAELENKVVATKSPELIRDYFFWLGMLTACNYGSDVYYELDKNLSEINNLIKECSDVCYNR